MTMEQRKLDEELVELARQLPHHDPAADRLEAMRSSLLDAARVVTPIGRQRGRTALAAATGAAVTALAAAGLFLWWSPRPDPGGPGPAVAPPRATIQSSSGAHFEHTRQRLEREEAGRRRTVTDEVVRLRGGRVAVAVAHLARDERFRVVTGDAEVEVRGTSFDVVVDGDRLIEVAVTSGVVDVRPDRRDPVSLAAGDRWRADGSVARASGTRLPPGAPGSSASLVTTPAADPATAGPTRSSGSDVALDGAAPTAPELAASSPSSAAAQAPSRSNDPAFFGATTTAPPTMAEARPSAQAAPTPTPTPTPVAASSATPPRITDPANEAPRRGASANPPRIAAAETLPRNAAVGTPPRNSAVGTPPRNSAVGTPPRNSAVGTPPRNSAAETLPRNAAAETLPRNAAAETLPRNAAAEPPPRNAAVGTPPRTAAVSTPPRNAAASTPPRNAAVSTPPRNAAAGTPPRNAAAGTPPRSAATETRPRNAASASSTRNATAETSPRIAASAPPPRTAASAAERPGAVRSGTRSGAAEQPAADSAAAAGRAATSASPADRLVAATAARLPTASEAAFGRGFRALRAGDDGEAASQFSVAVREAPSSALAADARYWRGVALARAGSGQPARAALAEFLARHRRHPRAGEASAMLGWLLLESGDRAGAARRFRSAISDPDPGVRASARKGLAAVAR